MSDDGCLICDVFPAANTFRLTDLDESKGGRRNITDQTAVVAQKAAILATLDMWNVSDPDDYDM